MEALSLNEVFCRSEPRPPTPLILSRMVRLLDGRESMLSVGGCAMSEICRVGC